MTQPPIRMESAECRMWNVSSRGPARPGVARERGGPSQPVGWYVEPRWGFGAGMLALTSRVTVVESQDRRSEVGGQRSEEEECARPGRTPRIPPITGTGFDKTAGESSWLACR